MAAPIVGVTLDCTDIVVTSKFWREALRYRQQDEGPAADQPFHALFAPEGVGGLHHLTLQRVPEPKSAKNRVHLDLFVDDLATEVARLVTLGALVLEEQPEADDGFASVVMADPEGNELCVVARQPATPREFER